MARSAVRAMRRTSTCSMEVPSDSFGGQSPERKAAGALRTLFTFCAVKCAALPFSQPPSKRQLAGKTSEPADEL